MSAPNTPDGEDQQILSEANKPTDRRKFLKVAGAGVGAAAVAAACEERIVTTQVVTETLPPETLPPETVPPSDIVLSLGDQPAIAALNFAWALEQLEAAFYAQVTAASPNAFSGRESEIFTEIYAHELTHALYLEQALGQLGAQNIPNLLENPDLAATVLSFEQIDFGNRQEVLNLSQRLEDTGVGAYNGAGKLLNALSNPAGLQLLTVAGKIVSVEARHAATIRDILHPLSRSFAGDDIVNDNGLGLAFTPPRVVRRVAIFLSDRVVFQGAIFPEPVRANQVPGGLMSIPGLSQQEG